MFETSPTAKPRPLGLKKLQLLSILLTVLSAVTFEEAYARQCKAHTLTPQKTTYWIPRARSTMFSVHNKGPAQVIIGRSVDNKRLRTVKKGNVDIILGDSRLRYYVLLRGKRSTANIEVCW